MRAYTIDLKLMADDCARAYRRAGFGVRTAEMHYSFPTTGQLGPTPVDKVVQTVTDQDSIFALLAFSLACEDNDHSATHSLIQFHSGVSLNIKDETSGYSFWGDDRLLPHQAITGMGQAPHVLGFPYICEPGTLFSATFRWHGEVTTSTLTLIGVKILTTPFTRRAIYPEVPGLEAV